MLAQLFTQELLQVLGSRSIGQFAVFLLEVRILLYDGVFHRHLLVDVALRSVLDANVATLQWNHLIFQNFSSVHTCIQQTKLKIANGVVSYLWENVLLWTYAYHRPSCQFSLELQLF